MLASHALSAPSHAHEDHDISALLEMPGRLTDPRSPQGKRHELVFTLACAVVAVLAGTGNFRQVGSQAADIPQSLLAKLGAIWNWFTQRHDPPSEPTLRRVLRDIDADELDLIVGALAVRARPPRQGRAAGHRLRRQGLARRVDRRQRRSPCSPR
jgi:hypothetical protein